MNAHYGHTRDAKVLVYLCSIIWDYFQDWVVLAQTASGMIVKKMTYGILQGPILGPLLWNITSDSILKEEVRPPTMPWWL